MNTSRTNRPRRPRRTSNRRAVKTTDVGVARELKELLRIQATNIHGSDPTVPDVPRILLKRDKVYTFERSVSVAVLNSPTSVNTYTSYSFTLKTIPNSSEFVALFDQYRISQVTLTFQPTTLVATSSPFYSVLDYDDANAPTSLNDLLQYDSLLVTETGSYHVRTFNPRASLGAYSGTLNQYASASGGMWFDVASDEVQYFGVKTCWPAYTGSNGSLNVLARYIVQFKFVR